jgi:hypothetical protein
MCQRALIASLGIIGCLDPSQTALLGPFANNRAPAAAAATRGF